MTLDIYKSIAAVAILLTSLVAVIYPIRMRSYPDHHSWLERGDAFASGIFLGAALFHMLPDALNLFSTLFPSSRFPLAESFCAGGFLFLLFLERLSGLCQGKNPTTRISLVLAIILIIHALVEGAALGISDTVETTSILFLAIIAHKGSESFALAIILNRSNLVLPVIILIVGLFSCMTPLGIFGGALLTESLQWRAGQILTAGFNAFAAGTFLYMSTLHHINHHHDVNERESFVEFWFLIFGLLIMAALAWWA